MQKGEIVAAGTPLHLKAKYGYGYRLILNSLSNMAHIRPPVNSAKFESSTANQIIWRIEDASDLGHAVRWADNRGTVAKETDMEIHEVGENKDIGRIEDWELTMPTLEDVLLERKLF